MNKRIITFVLASTLIGLTGCNGNRDAINDNNQNNVGLNNVRNNNNGVIPQNVSTKNLRVSTRASQNVERLGEVDRAHVIISNNDAYVAVRLANKQTDTDDRTGINTKNRTKFYQNTGTNNLTGTGTNDGTADISRNDNNTGTSLTGYNNNAGINRTAGNTGNNIENRNNTAKNGNINYYNAGANGNGTFIEDNENNANGDNTGFNEDTNNRTRYKNVSNRLEQKIADEVRSADKNIHRVYISYDNNFYNKMNTYSNDLRNGRNNNGLWKDFTNTVRGVFD
ncbi:YhcN/YlaJ family sporulation lipoprotein [Bacillus rubiinfantis]|uniref:YhcN/YlaJ family sporulation lipoprotein n=1 Tax=Bacillus rubiinfantis TaxID=1499680 RepID=UPI00069409B1|nr:YhcN/YlaJ family sporulation lipoprotein [Bacillus rubiinfantis]